MFSDSHSSKDKVQGFQETPKAFYPPAKNKDANLVHSVLFHRKKLRCEELLLPAQDHRVSNSWFCLHFARQYFGFQVISPVGVFPFLRGHCWNQLSLEQRSELRAPLPPLVLPFTITRGALSWKREKGTWNRNKRRAQELLTGTVGWRHRPSSGWPCIWRTPLRRQQELDALYSYHSTI